MQHFYEGIVGGFWFKSAYERLLSELDPTKPQRIVEVGSFHGRSAAFLGVEILNRGLPWTLTCVDNFSWHRWPGSLGDPREPCYRNLKPLIEARVVRICPVASVAAAGACAEETLDAVWIDADHSYRGCLADIRAWTPKLKPGGIVGGDDYEMPGVKQAVQETGPFETGEGHRWSNQYTGSWRWWWRRVP